MDGNALKISYCTTCKGRLHHLRETLPANLKAEEGNPNVEFVVLDYSSDDGLADWIKENFSEAMQSGRLRYARLDNAPHFKMAHAKNMAHRLATGDVLCNVDADNFIVPDFSRWLREQFVQNENCLVSCLISTLTDVYKKKIGEWKRVEAFSPGIGGRVAMSKTNFDQLRGYDERLSGWEGEDVDLVRRAQRFGLERVMLPKEFYGSVISHDNDARLKQLSGEDRLASEKRLSSGRWERSARRYHEMMSPDKVVNPDGNVGCGMLHINFSPEAIEIKPIPSTTREATICLPDWRKVAAATRASQWGIRS